MPRMAWLLLAIALVPRTTFAKDGKGKVLDPYGSGQQTAPIDLGVSAAEESEVVRSRLQEAHQLAEKGMFAAASTKIREARAGDAHDRQREAIEAAEKDLETAKQARKGDVQRHLEQAMQLAKSNKTEDAERELKAAQDLGAYELDLASSVEDVQTAIAATPVARKRAREAEKAQAAESRKLAAERKRQEAQEAQEERRAARDRAQQDRKYGPQWSADVVCSGVVVDTQIIGRGRTPEAALATRCKDHCNGIGIAGSAANNYCLKTCLFGSPRSECELVFHR